MFRFHRRLAGDARKRNPIIAAHLQGRLSRDDDQVGQGRSARDERRAVLLRHAPDRAPGPRAARERLHASVDLLKDHPELRLVGIAEAYAYAAANRDRYAEFFEADGSLDGPGFTADEAEALPERLRVPGVVVKGAAPA